MSYSIDYSTSISYLDIPVRLWALRIRVISGCREALDEESACETLG